MCSSIRINANKVIFLFLKKGGYRLLFFVQNLTTGIIMTQSEIHGDYVGWVPCLDGDLVFDLVECGLRNGDSTEIVHYAMDRDESLTEYIILNSTVDWKDFDNKKNELRGLWSVIVLSKRSIANKKHIGTIYFMLNQKSRDEPWRDSLETVREINLQLNTEQDIDIPEEFSRLEESLAKTCSVSRDCFNAKFILEQDGIVWIEPSPKNDDDRKLIARQAYYYIKYSWHKHRHHDARAETLTTAHKIETNESKIYIADRLIGDLKRNLVRFKREIDHTSHRDILKAKGIVSYTKALVEIMRSKGFIDNDFYTREINHLEYFQESLDIISSGIEKDMSLHSQAVNDARAFILFVFAMITPALFINKNSENTLGYIQWISDWYSSGMNFITLIAIITTYLFFYISIKSHYGNFWILYSGFKKLVTFIVHDREPNNFLSNTHIVCIIIILLSIFAVIFGIHGVSATINAN